MENRSRYKNRYYESVLAITAAFIITFSATSVQGEIYNWNLWKGPNRNGITDETDWDPLCLKDELKINWKINVGHGFSNIAIMGDYLYTMGYDEKNKENSISCLKVETGEKVWNYNYKASRGIFRGPKSSPVIDDGRVYTLGQDGDMLCNNAETGELIWKRQLVKEFKAVKRHYSFSSSVHIEKELAVVNACESGIALNKKTGKLVWKSEGGAGNYSTPVSYTHGKKTYFVIHGDTDLYTVRAKNGKIIWSYPWSNQEDCAAADPVIYNNKMFVSAAYGLGCALFDISNGKPELEWQNKNMYTHYSTAIIIDGYIYGISGHTDGDTYLKCLDLENGRVRWEVKMRLCNMIAANGYLICVADRGNIYIIKADPDRYHLISKQHNIMNRLCPTAPVLCRSTLYIRNSGGDLMSIDLSGQRKIDTIINK